MTVIAPKLGEVNGAIGEVNGAIGEVNDAKVPRTPTDDNQVYAVIEAHPGIKRDGIFLEIRTSLRSVERSLKRLREASRIEYRGSAKTGGWFAKT